MKVNKHTSIGRVSRKGKRRKEKNLRRVGNFVQSMNMPVQQWNNGTMQQ